MLGVIVIIFLRDSCKLVWLKVYDIDVSFTVGLVMVECSFYYLNPVLHMEGSLFLQPLLDNHNLYFAFLCPNSVSQ